MIGPGPELFPRGAKQPAKHKPIDPLSLLREWWISNGRRLHGAPHDMLRDARGHVVARRAILKALLRGVPDNTKGRIRCQLKLLASWCSQIDEELRSKS